MPNLRVFEGQMCVLPKSGFFLNRPPKNLKLMDKTQGKNSAIMSHHGAITLKFKKLIFKAKCPGVSLNMPFLFQIFWKKGRFWKWYYFFFKTLNFQKTIFKVTIS